MAITSHDCVIITLNANGDLALRYDNICEGGALATPTESHLQSVRADEQETSLLRENHTWVLLLLVSHDHLPLQCPAKQQLVVRGEASASYSDT